MTSEEKLSTDSEGSDGSLFVLAILALVVGVISGLVGALFLVSLERANRLRDTLLLFGHIRKASPAFWLSVWVAPPAPEGQLGSYAGIRRKRRGAAYPTSRRF